MKKILLVSLAMDKFSYSAEGRFKFKYMQRRPLLGLLYIFSAIESRGVECDFLDQSIGNFSVEDLINRINIQDYLFVGFYAQLLVKDKVIEYIRAIKEKCLDKNIIVGGPGYLCYEEFLDNGCDIVCRGEGELTITEIVDYMQGKKRIEEIDGIVYKRNGVINYNKDRELISNLDSVSFPLWHKVDIGLYYDYSVLPMQKPFAVMITSRGCLFQCAFCSSPFLWRNIFRSRSVENVIQEIDILVLRHGIRYIIFQDDVFGIDNNWLKEFCNSLISRGYRNLRWMCILHPLTLKKESCSLIKLMKKAGCNLFTFGLQSANPLILEKIGRNPIEPRALKDIIKIANRLGIMTSVDFILGFPLETKDTVRENINFALNLKPHLVNFHPLLLEPGSELERDYKKCGFSEEELLRLCSSANREFYFKIQNIFRIMKFMFRENVFLFLKIAKFFVALRYYLK
jgi:radical SAM superfamily enzyme YgiQ (UPF0313 family)